MIEGGDEMFEIDNFDSNSNNVGYSSANRPSLTIFRTYKDKRYCSYNHPEFTKQELDDAVKIVASLREKDKNITLTKYLARILENRRIQKFCISQLEYYAEKGYFDISFSSNGDYRTVTVDENDCSFNKLLYMFIKIGVDVHCYNIVRVVHTVNEYYASVGEKDSFLLSEKCGKQLTEVVKDIWQNITQNTLQTSERNC